MRNALCGVAFFAACITFAQGETRQRRDCTPQVCTGRGALTRPATRPTTKPVTKPALAKPIRVVPLASTSLEASTIAQPSMYWAVLANWLYFLSLGLNAVNMPFLVRSIVNEDGSLGATPAAIALSGKVESIDKILTFLGIGLLSALSDVRGRKPLMVWSAIGFALTNMIQASTHKSVGRLYLADLLDGCSSCMTPICQAFVADVSLPASRAQSLGIFQGLSIGGAFVLAFPIGGMLGTKFGPRLPLRIAAALQIVNAGVILFLMPESNPAHHRARHLNLRQANPLGALWRLFGRAPLMRNAATMFALVSLARNALDAQFVNYANIRFGWTSQQTGPVMVIVGLMLAIAPRVLVPWLGLHRAILLGLLVFASGLAGAGTASSPIGFIASIVVVSIGCVCIPALQGLLANLAEPSERGALLGALSSLTELTGAIGSTLYATVLATFTSSHPPLPLPGMHFYLGSALLLIAWVLAARTFMPLDGEKSISHKS